MKFRRLGDSDLQVSEISLGSWLTYSGGVGKEQAKACTEAAFEAGINFFDTSNIYGVGAAEEAWGEILSGHPRESYVLATKVYFPMSETDSGLSAEQIESSSRPRSPACGPTTSTSTSAIASTLGPIEETMEALTAAIERGSARCIGFSEWTPEQIRAGLDVPGAASSSPPSRSTT